MEDQKHSTQVLSLLGANGSVLEELTEYTKNRFDKNPEIPQEIKEEPFIAPWKNLISHIQSDGILETINQGIPHGDEDVVLEDPQGVNIEIYDSIAGPIPVIYSKNTKDFEELVVKLIRKGKKFPGIEKTGASFAHGKTMRFIILSYKPYSNIPAQELGLSDEQWAKYSLLIRREHECTHYFTKRFLGSTQNNIHDELIADFAGITSATGQFYADWFLIGLGIDKYPKPQKEMRFSIYTQELSDEAKDILKKVTIQAAKNAEVWSKDKKNINLSLREKILFLSRHSLTELYNLY